ncbi:MAG TPA: hypothetical protein DF699_12690, partial [Phycisphaerales bacterium]|nr:hypothetical protein [Phycisphaerales bacterium]
PPRHASQRSTRDRARYCKRVHRPRVFHGQIGFCERSQNNNSYTRDTGALQHIPHDLSPELAPSQLSSQEQLE